MTDSGTDWKVDVSSFISGQGTLIDQSIYSISWVFNGKDGTSGTSGSSGTGGGGGGTSGTSGTSGSSGTSGTSGTGTASISPTTDNNVLTANGTANSANSEPNLTFNGTTNVLSITGSTYNIHNPNTQLTTAGGYGDIVTFGTGASLTAGKVYYLNTSLAWTLTDANAASSATGMLGVALGTTVSDGLVVRGYVRNTAFTSTDGQILYLSTTTTGNLTSTAPSGALDIVRIVGYQISATNDIIYFNPSNDWVEI